MFDLTAFMRRVEAAGPDELAEILGRPSRDEEAALRASLGDERYQRMHRLVLRRALARSRSRPRGNVVVIPNFTGSNLAAVPRDGGQEEIWLNPQLITAGELQRLRLAEDGRSSVRGQGDVSASGIMKRHYGELLLALAGRWNVRSFWFDWRKDVRLAAAQLAVQLRVWFGDDAPVHLLGHGLGGLVARAFIVGHPEHWKALRDGGDGDAARGRLIMLGTPNRGCYTALQLITGADPVVRRLVQCDSRGDRLQVLRTIGSFVSLYQMLPDPELPGAGALYSSASYRPLVVSQKHLDDAWRLHVAMGSAIDAGRMVNVTGDGHPTPCGIKDPDQLGEPDGYEVSTAGDGRVPHELVQLPGVPTYYAREDHGSLISSPAVLTAIDDLLATGTTDVLPEQPVDTPRKDEASRVPVEVSPALEARRLEETLTRGLLSAGATLLTTPSRPVDRPSLRLELIYGRIDELGSDRSPADAIAVGHYLGVRPEMAELALDRAISQALPGAPPDGAALPEAGLLITQLAERGVLRGDLGHPFFLPDPRPGPDGQPGSRLIAIAGMGIPGRFRRPELTVMARELCWSLGQMGRAHLATVLIGAGAGNLPPRAAIAGWLRGAASALTGSLQDGHCRLRQITFVEADPHKLREIQDAILDEQATSRKGLQLEYDPIAEDALAELEATPPPPVPTQDGEPRPPAPTRLTLSLDRGAYRFGAITETASIPEREIPLDPLLVTRANAELAAETDPDLQTERGLFMERLLIPRDLRSELATGGGPLVLSLDATTARIHWELLANPEARVTPAGEERGQDSREAAFLSISRGLTRQLRTTFAPPPEPPPPPVRILRALVVADPAEDARLPGAEEEGAAVVELFEAFNRVYETVSPNRVEVVSLFGPREASRTNVLRHLMLRPFDVLHYAGHCVYDPDQLAGSGWVFTNRELLGARELSRVDRIPRFVFSNACESGVTPDRSDLRSAGLAPSFAEAFFQRGVVNFVCTAWPVDDVAAREFAVALYSRLLGLKVTAEEDRPQRGEPQPMHEALAAARQQVAAHAYGVGTWGAYQHYGNPYFRFFDPEALGRQ